ncbi:MAG: M48 family metallopeptidase [Bacteriovoracia bacterium]
MENLYSYYTQVLFLSLIVINHLFELYLSQRQVTTLHRNRNLVPTEFDHFLSLADHQKAADYATSKLRLGQAKLIWSAVLLFYWFPFRGAEKLYLALPFSGIHKEVGFLVSFGLIMMLINLPWSLYSTFVLEEKFGFNRSTPKLFIIDRLKGLLLGAILGLPLLYAILFIFQSAGKWWWLISFIVLTVFQFTIVWLYPTVIAPLFNKFKPLEGEDLKKGIENLVDRAGFHAKEVFVMDASKRSSHGNAYFTGFGKNKRVVFFDTLLKDLQNSEILAILAHELGHMKLKHIPKSMIASLIISFLGFWLMGVLSTQNWFYSGHFVRIISPGILFFLFMEALPVYSFWLSPIPSWISRKREFEADAYAAGETDAHDLISGLLKLYQQNASPVVTDEIYSGFYHSHPPALQRIRKLESLK